MQEAVRSVLFRDAFASTRKGALDRNPGLQKNHSRKATLFFLLTTSAALFLFGVVLFYTLLFATFLLFYNRRFGLRSCRFLLATGKREKRHGADDS